MADSRLGLSGILYANNVINTVASMVVTVAPDMPPPVNVYLLQHAFGTALVTADAGGYQYYPTYASDIGRWQPVFYAWSLRTPESNTQLQPVYAMALSVPGLPERLFYTIDPKERAALLGSGAFVDAFTGTTISATFAAIAPTGGVCPAGRITIYRAFEPKVVIHRYVPASTYRLLLANGWRGDGVAFCVAAEPAGASSWAPN